MIVGVHRGHVARLESGDRTPRLDTLGELAAALKVKVTSLLSEVEKPVPREREDEKILLLSEITKKRRKEDGVVLIRVCSDNDGKEMEREKGFEPATSLGKTESCRATTPAHCRA